MVSAGFSHTVSLQNDGTAVACGDNALGQCDIPPIGWEQLGSHDRSTQIWPQILQYFPTNFNVPIEFYWFVQRAKGEKKQQADVNILTQILSEAVRQIQNFRKTIDLQVEGLQPDMAVFVEKNVPDTKNVQTRTDRKFVIMVFQVDNDWHNLTYSIYNFIYLRQLI